MEGERVRTGITGYDKMLNGGYMPNSVNLLSGCSGTGKTIFAVSFIYQGAVKYGEKGIYITLEEDVSQIVENCKAVGMDLDAVEPGKIELFDISSLRKMYTSQEEFERKDSPLDLNTFIDLLKRNAASAQRIAIDSLVPLSLKYANINEFRAEMFRLRAALKGLKTTSLLTTEILMSSKDISRFGIEDFLADSVTLLKPTEAEGNFLRIHKIRGSDHLKDAVRYEITPTGIRVSYDDFKATI
ncbi:MAG: ATPase domain-containing protein [Candidatus Altiarchaeia archaeon]|jgi:KaiC/GvpD/RAD55 family RecA-like ATPase